MKTPKAVKVLKHSFPQTTKVIGNIHKVPAKMWSRWSIAARWTFNNMMLQTQDQTILTHPGYEKAEDAYWQTIRWNLAWIAADLQNGRKW